MRQEFRQKDIFNRTEKAMFLLALLIILINAMSHFSFLYSIAIVQLSRLKSPAVNILWNQHFISLHDELLIKHILQPLYPFKMWMVAFLQRFKSI